MPARPAMAVRWIMALVDPPKASKDRAAFSNASSVKSSDGRVFRRTRSTAVEPARSANTRRRESAPGMAAPPGGVMPRASHMTDIVLAVPITMQCPGER